MPPVSQCRKMHTATPVQEKNAGTNARRAKACREPDPDQGNPGQPRRRGLRRGRCRHNQPLLVYITQDAFLVVGGLSEYCWQDCPAARSHFLALKCYNGFQFPIQAQCGYMFP